MKNDYLERYDRQILLSDVGIKGQEKIKKAKVLVVGAGGLGSPILLYLAGAGVGTIGIVDCDTVSLTNLHRQVIHTFDNIGKNKAESAKESLLRINDSIRIETYPISLTSENASDICAEYDLIIDAVDCIEAKFLINDVCVLLKKPFIYAGVVQMHGQIMTYVPGKGPCLRCIFEDIPEKGSIPRAVDVGVLGPVVGVLGSLQATEALKYIVGSDGLLTGRMLTVDAKNMKIRVVEIPKSSNECRICSSKADIIRLENIYN